MEPGSGKLLPQSSLRTGIADALLVRLAMRRLSVKTKVTLVATALFLFALLMVSVIHLYYVKAEMKRVLADQQLTFVSRVADELDQKLLLHRTFVDAGTRTIPSDIIDDVGRLQKWADERHGLRAIFSDILVVSAKGVVLADTPQRGRRGIDVSDREYFRTTIETRKPYISKPVVGKGVKQPVVTFSAPVFDNHGAVIAVLTGSLNLLQPNFLGDLAEAKVGKTGSFAMFTRDRTIVISRDKSRILAQGPAPGVSPYFDRATSGLEGSEEAVNSRGLHAIYSYSQLETVPWVLVASLPIEEAYAPIQATQRRVVGATLLLGLLVAPLVWLAVRRLFDPLQAALREREAGLRRAQSMAKLAHVITGPDGHFESWSETLPTLAGVEPAQLPRTTRAWLDVLHPDDRSGFREKAIEAGVKRRRTEIEYRLRRADGESIQVRQTMEPLEAKDEAAGDSRWFNTLQDVTAQRRTEEELRESERRFSEMLGKVELVSLMLDREARISYCNDYLLRLTGWRREEVEGKNWFELFIPPDATELSKVFADLLADLPTAWHHENEILTRSGERRLVRWNNSVLRSGAGEVIGTASIGEDITEQKRAEVRIKRLNRVYAVLSEINSLIVRVRDRDDLFREACRIAVQQGQFRMAWVGLADREARRVKPVASEGDVRGFFDAAPLAAPDSKVQRRGLAWRAIEESRPMISNDVQSDPQTIMKPQCKERGINSLAMLPLVVAGEGVGVLALYAGERGFFDDEEMKLLMELAGDVSFALDHLQKADKLDYLAYHDPLTGLPNRALLHERLIQHVTTAERDRRMFAVLKLDLDRFRQINDSFGRRAGDALLKKVSERVVRAAPDPNGVARVGANRFAVVVPEVKHEDELARLIRDMLKDCFGEPFQLEAAELRVSAKVGAALYPENGTDAEALFKNAEAALEKAKQTGDQYLFYEQRMNERVAEKLSLENKLRQALEKDEFILHYQPKIDLETSAIVGVEALIRWQSPELGLVPPIKFIPLMEETGLILEVGNWALNRAALDHKAWVAAGLRAPRVAVNVSPIQLRQRDFVAMVERAIMEGVAPTGIDLEITESLIMEDIQGNIEKLNNVRALGIGVAIDDFGTGYSSLAYLARLPVQTLKIDRSFVITMLKDANTMTLVQTMISLAHSLRLKVVAEGVDAEEQAKTLRLLRCDQMQGYLFSKPLANEALVALLRN